MRNSLILFSAFAFLALAAAGCGKVALNLDGLNPALLGPNALSNGAEFVAATQNGVHSINGYMPSTSTGGAFSSLKTTTANGYQVFTSVQGQEVSDDAQ